MAAAAGGSARDPASARSGHPRPCAPASGRSPARAPGCAVAIWSALRSFSSRASPSITSPSSTVRRTSRRATAVRIVASACSDSRSDFELFEEHLGQPFSMRPFCFIHRPFPPTTHDEAQCAYHRLRRSRAPTVPSRSRHACGTGPALDEGRETSSPKERREGSLHHGYRPDALWILWLVAAFVASALWATRPTVLSERPARRARRPADPPAPPAPVAARGGADLT